LRSTSWYVSKSNCPVALKYRLLGDFCPCSGDVADADPEMPRFPRRQLRLDQPLDCFLAKMMFLSTACALAP